MADDWRTYSRVALLVVGGLVALTLIVAASTTTASFSAYNSAWDGGSALRDVADTSGSSVTVETEVNRAYARESATVFVLSPDTAYTDEEIKEISRFVENGGTLVVADDFGPHTNSLLAGVGAQTRLDGRLLRDEQNYYRSPNLTTATGVANASLVGANQTLRLNHATVLRPNGAEVVATSSEYAYLDGNRNYELDETEEMQSRPVVTRETIGNGSVVVVSDASLFINSMVEHEGNRAFIRALIAEHADTVLDYSHTESVPPIMAIVLMLRANSLAQVMVGLVSFGLIGVVVRRRERLLNAWEENTESDLQLDRDAVAAHLESTHPEWEPERIQRVMRGIITDDSKEDAND